MVVISKSKLYEKVEIYPEAKFPIEDWYLTTTMAEWTCFLDIKKDFPSVDYVKNDRYVFNIKGNKYRLVVMIHFTIRTIYIRFFGTHSEYNKIDCSTI
jgi:mRNA interferase HigB